MCMRPIYTGVGHWYHHHIVSPTSYYCGCNCIRDAMVKYTLQIVVFWTNLAKYVSHSPNHPILTILASRTSNRWKPYEAGQSHTSPKVSLLTLCACVCHMTMKLFLINRL
jgi:hypothetical protein